MQYKGCYQRAARRVIKFLTTHACIVHPGPREIAGILARMDMCQRIVVVASLWLGWRKQPHIMISAHSSGCEPVQLILYIVDEHGAVPTLLQQSRYEKAAALAL